MSQLRHILDLASEEASKSNCMRKSVGAVIYDSHTLQILGSGSNIADPPCRMCRIGRAPNKPCGSTVHAEINALRSVQRPLPPSIGVYTTLSPCINCAETLSKVLGKRLEFWGYGELYRDQTGLIMLDTLGISNREVKTWG